jgi:hypothetical protein
MIFIIEARVRYVPQCRRLDPADFEVGRPEQPAGLSTGVSTGTVHRPIDSAQFNSPSN